MTRTALLIMLGGSIAFSGCAVTQPDEDRTPREEWGSNDDPLRFDPDLEYEFDALPLQGEADPIPWAGSYWPTAEDSINVLWDGADSRSAAAKYGEAFGIEGVEDAVSSNHGIDHYSSRTACTEDSQCNSDIGEACARREGETDGYCIPTWWGLCHGWAPAAILEPEPINPVTHNGVTFEINDIKALMTLMYTSTSTKFLSSRNNDSESSGDIEFDENGRPEDIEVRDTNPGTFHVIAANFLGIQHKAFAEDRTYDLEVWNQPVRGFEVTQKTEVTAIEANALVGVTTVGGNTVEHAGTVVKDEWLHFDPVEVEAGQTVKVTMTGTGDGDLHVRFDEQPTASDYDCRPYDGGSNETCEIQVPEGKSKVFTAVKGYADTSDVELTINYGGEVATEYAFNANAARLIHIKATLQYITESASNVDGNLSGSIGTYTRSDNYEYVLELDHEGRIIGGEWVGDSVREHPDFLWLPLSQTGASKAGGKITYDHVKQLLDMSVAAVDPNDDDDEGDTESDTVSGTVAQGEWTHHGPYPVDFNQNLTATMTGTGDADLYVKVGSQPTDSSYDCRPYEGGSSEECTVGGPGDVYVSVYGYASSSDYSVAITWEAGEGDEGNGDEGNGDEGNGDATEVEQTGTVAAEEWAHFGPFDVATGGMLLAEMSGTGDADLYVKAGSQPSADSYDCRPYASGSDETCEVDGPGAIYVSVNGYAETSDFELYIIYNAS